MIIISCTMATFSDSKTTIYLSEYAEKLVGNAKQRYEEKISEIGLFDEKYLKMNYSDLLKECHKVKLAVYRRASEPY